MGHKSHSNINYGQYDCSLEELNSRNRSILIWLSIGICWLWLFVEIFNIQWFWEEFFTAATESGWQVITEDCEITDSNSCEQYVYAGGRIWWALLAILLTGISVGPLVFAGVIFTYRTKAVTHEWLEKVWTSLFFINPSIIWAFIWLVCFPFTWTLLPWGEWATNWWKIFPFGFGLVWLGILPMCIILYTFFDSLFKPEYTFDIEHQQANKSKTMEEEITKIELKATDVVNTALKDAGDTEVVEKENFWDTV